MASAGELIKFVRGLRQVREYTPEPVSDEIIDDILDVGLWSGTSANKQPTEVVVVKDPEVKRKIGDWGAKPASTAAVAFVILSRNKPFSFDEGRLGERMMLAARAHGLGSSFATLKEDGPEEFRKLVGAPDSLFANVVISVGHIDQQARATREKRPGPPRKAMSEFAHRERY